MNTIARTLVRVMNHRTGMDAHMFIYGHEDRDSREELDEAFQMLTESHVIADRDFVGGAMEGIKTFGDKRFGSYHHEGWLLVIRQDRVIPNITLAAYNDNEKPRPTSNNGKIAN